jgi:hypothetical protein
MAFISKFELIQHCVEKKAPEYKNKLKKESTQFIVHGWARENGERDGKS